MGKKRGPVTVYPRPCQGTCGRTLRPSRSKAADYPDTVLLSGLGRCALCRGAMAHNGQAREAHTQQTTEQNRASVESWLASHWRPSKTVKVVKP